jgi:hypothetical protein
MRFLHTSVSLPSDATNLSFETRLKAHIDASWSNAKLELVIDNGSQARTVYSLNNGYSSGDRTEGWLTRSVDISQFAGENITISMQADGRWTYEWENTTSWIEVDYINISRTASNGSFVGDDDGDRLKNHIEDQGLNTGFGSIPTDPQDADSDGDGLSDGDEVSGKVSTQRIATETGAEIYEKLDIEWIYQLKADPSVPNTDGTGPNDRIESSELGSNPRYTETISISTKIPTVARVENEEIVPVTKRALGELDEDVWEISNSNREWWSTTKGLFGTAPKPDWLKRSTITPEKNERYYHFTGYIHVAVSEHVRENLEGSYADDLPDNIVITSPQSSIDVLDYRVEEPGEVEGTGYSPGTYKLHIVVERPSGAATTQREIVNPINHIELSVQFDSGSIFNHGEVAQLREEEEGLWDGGLAELESSGRYGLQFNAQELYGEALATGADDLSTFTTLAGTITAAQSGLLFYWHSGNLGLAVLVMGAEQCDVCTVGTTEPITKAYVGATTFYRERLPKDGTQITTYSGPHMILRN